MPRPLKAFTTGNNGFINQDIQQALELPDHVHQANVLAVAPTKAEAFRMLAERGFRRFSISDPNFRQATGNQVDALREAGLLDQPGVLVTPSLTRPGDRVVSVDTDGVPQILGRLQIAGRSGFLFEADHDATAGQQP